MNCIVVDDDEMSRNAMKHLVSQVQFISLVGTCCSGAGALNILNTNKIDLMLLDIEMPDMTGLELVKSLKAPPLTILTTSRKEYAIEAFECNVVDYLVKPILLDRFFKAITKAKEIFENAHQIAGFSNEDYIFIKNNGILVKINLKEILWIEALGDYMTINTTEKKYTIHSTMKMIESKLDPNKFIRVHRSSIVSLDYITSIEDNVVVVGKKLIPVGAVYKENLTKRLNLL
ncbi:MAG: LytTR family DNA-binding domain-containing protein [Bacteroidota bacterium]